MANIRARMNVRHLKDGLLQRFRIAYLEGFIEISRTSTHSFLIYFLIVKCSCRCRKKYLKPLCFQKLKDVDVPNKFCKNSPLYIS